MDVQSMNQNERAFSVVPEGTPWPSGDYYDLAHLPIDEASLQRVIGVPLMSGVEDGLGRWVAIGLTLRSGVAVEIIRYDDSPGPPGFVARADTGADLAVALDELLSLFSLSRDQLWWISPRVTS
jgi:hypothetical protein